MSLAADRRRLLDWTTAAVVVVTVLALALRVVALGARPFHWDEGRVGYWTLRYVKSGAFAYRPVAGGPFLPILNRYVFAAVGVSDAAARLLPAVLGGLLPATALLFRRRLRDGETVLLAVFLAANPLLLYYSRFGRGDVPLAFFGVLFVGSVLRARDTDDRRWLYAAALALAFALTTSGFAVAYLVVWGTAAALTADELRVVRAGPDAVADRVGNAWRWLDRHAADVAGGVLVLFAVVIFFYAPRAGTTGGPGLFSLSTFPVAVDEALVGSFRKFWGVRVAHREGHPLLPFLAAMGRDVVAGGAVALGFGVYGFLRERYSPDARPLVAFAAYWAGVAAFVFPVVTEIRAPWVAVHVVLPLAIPAAVGAATLLRWGSDAVRTEDAGRVAVTALLVFASIASVGTVVADDVYGPQNRHTSLAQYGQPADDLDPLFANASRAMQGNDGVDVLYVGERFYTSYEPANAQPPVSDSWGNRLPLPWYFERLDARTDSVETPAELSSDPPPVVVADPEFRGELLTELPNHTATEYRLALWNREVLVFVAAS